MSGQEEKRKRKITPDLKLHSFRKRNPKLEGNVKQKTHSLISPHLLPSQVLAPHLKVDEKNGAGRARMRGISHRDINLAHFIKMLRPPCLHTCSAREDNKRNKTRWSRWRFPLPVLDRLFTPRNGTHDFSSLPPLRPPPLCPYPLREEISTPKAWNPPTAAEQT